MYWTTALGVATGMRSMTGMAVMCWFAWLGLLPQHGWGFWAGNIVSVIVFTVLALGEYWGDTQTFIPNRTDAGPLGARIVFGGIVAGLAAHATLAPTAGGVLFGVVGALIGAFGGIRLRLWAAKKIGRDLPVALAESAFALGLALYSAWQYHMYYVLQQANG